MYKIIQKDPRWGFQGSSGVKSLGLVNSKNLSQIKDLKRKSR